MRTNAAVIAVMLVAALGAEVARAAGPASPGVGPWTPQAAPQTPAGPQLDVKLLRVFQDRIVTAAPGLPARVSLAELVRRVLRDPEEGAAAAPEDTAHRAAIVALAFYVNGWPLTSLAPESSAWPRPVRRTILLRGRHDLAQHFTVSAVIAAFAGTPVAAAVGLYKEMDDARGTSGFSFTDLAADRAGTVFGDMATRSRESAGRLKSRVTEGLVETDMMPAINGLPDNLSQEVFTQRFGSVGTPAYNELVDEINRRVAALPLYQ